MTTVVQNHDQKILITGDASTDIHSPGPTQRLERGHQVTFILSILCIFRIFSTPALFEFQFCFNYQVVVFFSN